MSRQFHNLDSSAYEMFSIRDGLEWTTVYVCSIDRSLRVVVDGTFGTFAHFWYDIGDRPWWEFLAATGLDATMTKFMGNDFKEIDWDASHAALRVDITPDINHVGAADPAAFVAETLADFDLWEVPRDHVEFANMHDQFYCETSMSDVFVYKHKGWVENFWSLLWVPFIEAVTDQKKDA